ncbi:MAG: SprA-related family protein [Deltaproteobacteria bacterium ADurb.Bin510]|nr:MAG: SprA-related family protein [Deltaproteobacteria bacterium ADurb.Bin510]
MQAVSGYATSPQTLSNRQSPDNQPAAQASTSAQVEKLSRTEAQRVKELEQIDQRVRAHEAAHLAAAGGLARGGASFSYTKGPDGKLYASGGEVSIDTSSERTPQATIQKMRRVRTAALAPADPSGQDRRVAAQASAKEAAAARELGGYNGLGQAAAIEPLARGQKVDVLA